MPNTLPDRQGSLVNIVGVNSPQLKIAGVQSPQSIQMEDVTNQKFQQVNQSVNQAYQSQLQALQSQAQSRAKVAEAQGQTPARSQLSGLIGTVVDTYSKYQDSQAKAKQAAFDQSLKIREADRLDAGTKLDQTKFAYSVATDQQKTEQGQAQASVQTVIQQILLNTEEEIQKSGSLEGIHTTRANLEGVLRENADKLSPEGYQTLQGLVFNQLQQLEQKQSTVALNNASALKTNLESQRRSLLTTQLSTLTSGLDNPSLTPEQAQNIFSQIDEKTRRELADLSPLDRMNITAPLLQAAAERLEKTSSTRTGIQQRLASMGAFYQWYQQEGLPQLGNNPTALRAAALAKATQLGVPDIADQAKNNSQLISEQRKYQDDYDALVQSGKDRQNAELAARAPEYLNQRASLAAFGWLNSADPNAQADMDRIKALGDKATTVEKQSLQAYNRYQGYISDYQKAQTDYAAAVEHQQSIFVRQQNVGQQEYVDTASGRAYRVPIQDAQGNTLLMVEGATKAQADAAAQAVALQEQKIHQIVENASHGGLNVTNPTDPTYINQFQAQAEATAKAAESLPQFRQLVGMPPYANTPGSNQPNFNQAAGSGYPASPHVVAFARTSAGANGVPAHMLVPVANNHGVTITAGFGDDPSITHHDHFHSGIDIAPNDAYDADVGALAVQGGTVINSADWNGFGGTVMVRTPDGRIEQYSHLRRLFVHEGDQVPPGTPLGVVGGDPSDPMSGGSTGRHIHFQVWQSGTADFAANPAAMVDPIEYLSSINQNELKPPSLGSPPSTSYAAQPPTVGAMPIPAGLPQWITNLQVLNAPPQLMTSDGQHRPASEVFNRTNPIPQTNAPIDRSAYPARNDPTANYGYAVLARDKQYASALASLGDSLDIPAQWLADVIQAESGHDPHIDNGLGYVGLIQINGDSRAEYGYSYEDVQRMSRADYLNKIARPYLMAGKGQIHTLEDLYAFIYGGAGLLHTSVSGRQSSSDGWSSFGGQIDRMGNSVGRHYRSSYNLQSALPTHEDYVAGCPTCNMHVNHFGSVIPHEAIG